jgi:hypothetical protein
MVFLNVIFWPKSQNLLQKYHFFQKLPLPTPNSSMITRYDVPSLRATKQLKMHSVVTKKKQEA